MNGTKVFLLLTIVGLVGASGYLIWKRSNPSPAVAEKGEPGDKDDAKAKDTPTQAADPERPTPVAGKGKKLPEAGAVPDENLPEVAQNDLPQQSEVEDDGRQLPDQGSELAEMTEFDERPLPAKKASLPRVRTLPGDQVSNDAETSLPESADLAELEPVDDPATARLPAEGDDTASLQPLEPESTESSGDIEPVQSTLQDPEPIDPESAEPEPQTLRKDRPAPRIDGWEPEELPRSAAARPSPEAASEPDPVEVPGKTSVRPSPRLQPQESPKGNAPAKRVQPARSSYVEEGTDPTAETYVVQPGDNFWKIARKSYGTGRYFLALKKHNEAKAPDPYNLRPGLELATPSRDTLKATYPELIDLHPADAKGTRRGQASVIQPAGLFFGENGEPLYRVTEDDTLSGISQKHLGRASRWPEIYDRNRGVLADTETLKPGTILMLPSDASQLSVVETP